MHSVELGNGVPAFLIKLWKLVEDPESSELICWSSSGLSFIIHDQSKFAKDLLPLYFKHNNMASFIRQLNMYGFRKAMNVEQGRLRGGERDDVEFFHQYFLKGKIHLLEFIKRKVPSSRTAVAISTATAPASAVAENGDEGPQVSSDSLKNILSTMSNLKTKQEGVDSQLNSMKQENEALWREVAYLRQKHIKQQQIVDKLIHFLVSLVQPKRNISVKRKLPLMLPDGTGSTSHRGKAPRLISRQISKNNAVSICSPNGPVIHDVTDFMNSPHPVPSPSLEDDYVETVSPVINIPSPESMVNSPLGTEEHMEPLSILDPLQNIEPVSPAEALSFQLEDKSEENEGHNRTDDSSEPVSPKIYECDILNGETVALPVETKADHNDQNQESRMQIALSDNATLPRDILNDHLESIETELSWLQEQLSNGTPINLDTSALLGLFSTDDTVPGNNFPTEPISLSGSNVSGNELMQYVPSLLDLDTIDEEFNPDSPGPSSEHLNNLLEVKLDTPVVEMQPPFDSLQS